jgi:hypothetical protein
MQKRNNYFFPAVRKKLYILIFRYRKKGKREKNSPSSLTKSFPA